MLSTPRSFLFFFFNDTATTEIYTLSLHDALPIWQHLDDFLAVDAAVLELGGGPGQVVVEFVAAGKEGLEVDEVLQPALLVQVVDEGRSEEHTSELQSHLNLVCRLLLEKKKTAQRH